MSIDQSAPPLQTDKLWRTAVFGLIGIIFLLHFCAPLAYASENPYKNSAITIINFVRGAGLGHETDNLLEGLKAQWEITKEEGIPASTWLLQYGVLEDASMLSYMQANMKDQEFGLMFEIDRNFAEKSKVVFRGQGSWYFSDGLFLNSYDREERKKLIDTAFGKFKAIFGYYPKTVGAWWMGADSLTYMQKTYGITSTLRAADQYQLDFYSIWGTPWNIPYIPSRYNQAIPASTFHESAKVVVLQWAIRDPLRGYSDPLYSLQDHSMKNLHTDYIDYLASLYLNRPYGNLVMGLENSNEQSMREGGYRKTVRHAKQLENSGVANIQFARDFSEHFLSEKKPLPSIDYTLAKDYLSDDQSFWYISPLYRATIFKQGDAVSLVDVRDYSNKVSEDFSILPNTQAHLRINTNSIIDSQRNKNSSITLASTSGLLRVASDSAHTILFAGDIPIGTFSANSMNLMGRTYLFSPKVKTSFSTILVVTASIYLLISTFVMPRKRAMYVHTIILIIPITLIALRHQYDSIWLFDMKEILYLYFASFIPYLRVDQIRSASIYTPLCFLLVTHLMYIKLQTSIYARLYLITFCIVTFISLTLPYFPLDKQTFPFILRIAAIGSIGILLLLVFLWKKYPSRNHWKLGHISLLLSICVLLCLLLISRTRLSLQAFEIQALEEIKLRNKPVIYIQQTNYGVRPIYKSVRPLLYERMHLLTRLTKTRWSTAIRPDTHVTELTNYESSILYVPRYLGSDFSEYEMERYGVVKIFDNAHIALFEKHTK